jgi:hypothetical protein
VDDDQAGERQPYIGVDGVADVQELQGSERCRGEDQETQVHKPAGPDAPSGPRLRPSCDGTGSDRLSVVHASLLRSSRNKFAKAGDC